MMTHADAVAAPMTTAFFAAAGAMNVLARSLLV